MTWDPESSGFWLTRDYFPELLEIDKPKFPTIEEFRQFFEDIEVIPLLIPHDCADGFLGAYWRRPHYYLDGQVRAGMSTFAELDNTDRVLKRLAGDLHSGHWQQRNSAILDKPTQDLGYRLVVADFKHK